MPHVIAKLRPGKSEKQKQHLARTITKDIMENLVDYRCESRHRIFRRRG